jgi:hypothetical protein
MRDEIAEDSKLQQHAIEGLAHESGQPISVVAEVYQAELARLKEGARLQDFLVLFAARRTREALSHAAHQRLAGKR